jgi:autotransporter-associated beta strand protein
MNSPRHPLSALLLCGLLLLIPNAPAQAGSATWSLNPATGDWNTAVNWMPNTVPNGPSDTATFDVSTTTQLSSSDDIEVNSIVFSLGAGAFTIDNNPGVALTISGAGITNSSGVLQNFVNLDDQSNGGELYFTNSATAGDSVVYTNQRPVYPDGVSPLIQFEDSSTAGSAEFINFAGPYSSSGGVIEFQGNSTAASGTFRNTGRFDSQSFPHINFRDQASAGQALFTTEAFSGGMITFYDSTTADHATFDVSGPFGSVVFYDNSTAGSATITNEGGTYYLGAGATTFLDSSTAGDGLFIANGSLYNGIFGNANVHLSQSSKANNGRFIANGGKVSGANGGAIILNDDATAESGTFYANGATVDGAFAGRVIFSFGEPTAATATLIATGGTGDNDGGEIVFAYSSVGAEARVELFGNGFLDLRDHDTPELTIGSLEGDGLVFLGGANLSVGSNNLSTSFSGLIEETSEGTTGALTKIGASILTLSGVNTYAGGTTVHAGGLVINNTTGSGTGTGPVQVTAGTLAGRGIIAGTVTIGTGSGTGAFLAPGKGASTLTTLTIQRALTFKPDSTYTCRLNTKKTKADQVVAKGVTIESGAQFNFKVIGNKELRVGKSATVISNTSANSISGTFANLPDGSTFTIGANSFQADYTGGNGNDLTLTVVP